LRGLGRKFGQSVKREMACDVYLDQWVDRLACVVGHRRDFRLAGLKKRRPLKDVIGRKTKPLQPPCLSWGSGGTCGRRWACGQLSPAAPVARFKPRRSHDSDATGSRGRSPHFRPLAPDERFDLSGRWHVNRSSRPKLRAGGEKLTISSRMGARLSDRRVVATGAPFHPLPEARWGAPAASTVVLAASSTGALSRRTAQPEPATRDNVGRNSIYRQPSGPRRSRSTGGHEGFRFELRVADGDDAGSFETSEANWQSGETVIAHGNSGRRRPRLPAANSSKVSVIRIPAQGREPEPRDREYLLRSNHGHAPRMHFDETSPDRSAEGGLVSRDTGRAQLLTRAERMVSKGVDQNQDGIVVGRHALTLATALLPGVRQPSVPTRTLS
jgi:hypothetical protein